ncbi:replication initiation protein [Photobacterium damselae]|nr:replication initiation protein [Photobacterium damselae]
MNLLTKRVEKHLAKKPYCSNDKTASLIRNAATALLYPTIQLNPPHLCAWLIFDIDQVFKGFISDYQFSGTYVWEDSDLPLPNYVAINSSNGHYHLAYAISAVFTTENARVHPLEYLAAIERTYTRLLNADANYVGLMTHNPLHDKWQTIVFHHHEYSLAELQNGMKLDPKKKKAVNLGGYSRHIDLFDTLRFAAYERVVDSNVDYDTLYSELLELADKTNREHFSEPLSSLRAVTKSVAKYCIRNRATIYIGNKPKERKLQLDESQPLATRQAIGAIYTNEKRSNDVLEKMRYAYNHLINKDIKATQKAVQERSGVGIATVKRYWKEIK